MSYPKGKSETQHLSNATTQSLQAYVTELSVYINENNEKYTRNLQTLKQFYEDQICELNETIVQQQQDLLALKNQCSTLKNLLLNNNTMLNQLSQKNSQLKSQINELQEKNKQEKQKNHEVYRQIDNLRLSMQSNMDKEIQKVRNSQTQKAKIILQLKEKQSQIRALKQQINEFQLKIEEKYSLPQRLKSLQIQQAKDQTKIINLQEKLRQMGNQRELIRVQLQKKRRQNEKLTIQSNKSKGDLQFEVEHAVRKECQKLKNEIQKLKSESDRKAMEIDNLEGQLKQKVWSYQKLTKNYGQNSERVTRLQKQLKQLKEDKNQYLNEFRALKKQYEQVINNLQIAIPEYQKKNWALQQQNQELNSELDGLKELLRQLKAMNDLQPMRKQYKDWAELNLMAQKNLHQDQVNKGQSKIEKKCIVKENEVETSSDWDKLVYELEKIKI